MTKLCLFLNAKLLQHLKVNSICHNNRGEKSVVNSKNAEKAFHKIQYPVTKKLLV